MPKFPGGTSAGLVWKLGDDPDTPVTYNEIPNVLAAGKVGAEKGEIDVTAFGDDWSDTVPGIRTGNTITLRVAFDPANTVHQQLKEEFDDSSVISSAFALEHVASAREVGFKATILGFSEGADDPNAAYEAEITIKIVNPGVAVLGS